MNRPQQTVIIDNCAVDRLAEFGVNPVEDFQDTEFRLMYTPDLKLEYEQALSSSAGTSQQARTLIEQILKTGTLIGFFGFDDGPCLGFDRGVWAGQDQCDVIASVHAKAKAPHRPGKRTDAHLVALAQNAIVITANINEAHWMRSPKGAGLGGHATSHYTSFLRNSCIGIRPENHWTVLMPAESVMEITG
jgi:hypothetical protein